jgi:hypothetical protein
MLWERYHNILHHYSDIGEENGKPVVGGSVPNPKELSVGRLEKYI